MEITKFNYGNLILNDSLKYIKTLPDNSIDMILTDPPYFYENKKSFQRDNSLENNKIGKTIKKTMNSLSAANIIDSYNIEAYFIEFIRISKKVNWAIYCNDKQLLEYLTLINKYDLSFKLLKWIKTNVAPFNIPYINDTEYCLYIYNQKTGIPNFIKDYNYRFTYWINSNISADNLDKGDFTGSKFHPTPKPLRHIEKLIEKHTEFGNTILDCFSGSGSTAIVCERLKRNWIAIELNKDFYTKSIQRIKEQTRQTKLELEME